MKYRELTTEQYRDFCMMMLLLSHTDQYVLEWMPEDRKVKLKQASKLIAETVATTVKEMSRAGALRLKQNLDNVDLFCLPKPEAERKVAEHKRINMMRLREEAFIVLLEQSMQHCKYPCGNNYKNCVLKKILMEVEAPKWDPKARMCCPYEQRLDVKKE